MICQPSEWSPSGSWLPTVEAPQCAQAPNLHIANQSSTQNKILLLFSFKTKQALPSLTKVSTKYKHRTMLSTLSSTRLSSTSLDTGDPTASCAGEAGASPSFDGVLSAPPRDPLRERRRRNDLLMLSLRDFFLDNCSPLSVSRKERFQVQHLYSIYIHARKKM